MQDFRDYAYTTLLILFILMVPSIVMADDSPEPTIVEVQEAAAPFGPYTNWPVSYTHLTLPTILLV